MESRFWIVGGGAAQAYCKRQNGLSQYDYADQRELAGHVGQVTKPLGWNMLLT